MFDLIIRGGTIADGSGREIFKSDIAIKDKKIVQIGEISDKGKEIINAENMIVCPGFIDIHSHSDLTLIVDSKAESKIRQGITTEVVGNCGSSFFPLHGKKKKLVEKFVKEKYGFSANWNSFSEYVKVLEENKPGLNIIPLMGYNTLRASVAGFEDKKLTSEEKEIIREIISDYMEEGGFGLSSGLIYSTGLFTTTDEIIDACKIVAKYNGLYTSHIRGEDNRVFDAVREAIQIAESSGVSLQISHLKILNKENWHLVNDLISLIKENRNKIDVFCDQYPYIASFKGLKNILPSKFINGGDDKLIERLRDKKQLELIKEELSFNPDNIILSFSSNKKQVDDFGKSIAQISKEKGKEPFEVFVDLLKSDVNTKTIFLNQSEDNIKKIMTQDFVMFGSDGYAVNNTNILGRGFNHPRDYGTFPRIISKYVREEKVLTLPLAIKKMTLMPAERLGLKDRGLLKEGMFADITIFDFNTINDCASFETPNKYPEGIKYVLVNGSIAVKNGEHTGNLAGEVLRK